MNVILTYDLTGSNSPVKKTMIENGYSIFILSDGKLVHLPETTLFHKEKTPAQAIADLQLAAGKHNVKVTRAIATELNGVKWQALYGEPLK